MTFENEADVYRLLEAGHSKEEILRMGYSLEAIERVEFYRQKTSLDWDDVASALSSTIKEDYAPKVITFCAMLLSKTEDDQINIGFQAESSTGKSYIPLEVASYFPPEDVREIAGASPTAFFHEYGAWDDERKVMLLDLEGKILIFLDAPDYRLLEKLRPLLSHDRKILTYKITDKTQRHGLRTKTVELKGFPTVIFCSTKLNSDDQERTRLLLVSPSVDQSKLRASLELVSKKISNKSAYEAELNRDPRRLFLKRIVERVFKENIKRTVIEGDLLAEFLKREPKHRPRDMRDLPRIASLIKAHALLNYEAREFRSGELLATPEDIEAGFQLYEGVRLSNELGISPFVMGIYQEVFLPLFRLSYGAGVPRKEVFAKYYQARGRPASVQFWEREVFPSLETAGLIRQEADPDDKRRKVVYPPDSAMVNPSHDNNSGVRG